MSNKVYVQVGVKGRSMPAGGTKGYVLAKASNNDFDTAWVEPAGGASAIIPSAAVAAPLKDVSGGSAGDQEFVFARGDHQHDVNVGSTAPEMDASSAAAGTSTVYARADHKHPYNTYSNGFAPTGKIVLTSNVYGTTLPSSGNTTGIIFFKKV